MNVDYTEEVSVFKFENNVCICSYVSIAVSMGVAGIGAVQLGALNQSSTPTPINRKLQNSSGWGYGAVQVAEDMEQEATHKKTAS